MFFSRKTEISVASRGTVVVKVVVELLVVDVVELVLEVEVCEEEVPGDTKRICDINPN